MATKKSAAEECCAKCESDIVGLKKEIAALKKELKAKSSGGADPRVDKIVEALKLLKVDWPVCRQIIEKLLLFLSFCNTRNSWGVRFRKDIKFWHDF